MRIILLLIIIFNGYVFADNGQILYETHCIECHSRMTGGDGNVLYKRKDKIAKTYEELLDRVEFCAQGVSANWGKPEIEAVTHYLNEKYYQY